MSNLYDAHPLRTTMDDFIEGLCRLKADTITKSRVAEFVATAHIQAEALSAYIFWRENGYTRNLIYRDDWFEIMVICWGPGQKTPVHTHNGQLGWMTVVQGELLTHQYRYMRCSAPENQNVVGIDCLAGAHDVELEFLNTIDCANDGKIVTVDKLQSIHQIENADRARPGCVSLHVYSKPFDSCVAFDMEKHLCWRRSLKYYSRQGVIVTD
jgi:cysteine dioxygenase